jgi:hypothetical protein
LIASQNCPTGPAAQFPYDESKMDSTNRKIFWIVFTILSLGGYFLPFGWAIAEMFLSVIVSWWIVYRSGLL